jgi:hypothetical protein
MDTDPALLAFLKRQRDGRFVPVTGHYHSEPSFRVLATPICGAVRYAVLNGIRKANERLRSEGSPSAASTNRTALQAVHREAPKSPQLPG